MTKGIDLKQTIRTSADSERLMSAYVKRIYGKVINPKFSIHDFASGYFDKEKCCQILQYLSYIQKAVDRSVKILDAGTGSGLSVIGFRKLGYNVFGYEIDQEIWDISQRLLLENGLDSSIISLVPADYQRLPYADRSFDIIFSYFVLEHVQNPVHYLSELSRILKRDGKILMVCANYNIPYETHYGLFIFPATFNGLNIVMLKALGREVKLLSQLSCPTPRKLNRWIRAVGLKGGNLSGEYFMKSLFYDKDYSFRSPAAISIAKVCARLKLTWLVKILVDLLDLYNPIFYVLEHQQ